MATYTTSYPGNTALQAEIWTLTHAEAKAALLALPPAVEGSYWYTTLLRPLRRANRSKETTVRVQTAGFSSSELSNALRATGATITR